MTIEALFTQKDKDQISSQGLSVEQIREQIKIFKEGAVPLKLNRPCKIGDGIRVVTEKEGKILAQLHDEEARIGRMLKFVPASGAASRMFKDWYNVIDTGRFDDERLKLELLQNLRKFAFFDDLKDVAAKNGQNLDELIERGEICIILSHLLEPSGLNYGELPKALLKFHRSQDCSRAAIEEHLVEAALYVKDARGVCRIHFTVSAEHEKAVDMFLKGKINYYEKLLKSSFDLSLSIQHAYTNTIAVDMAGEPFRDQAGFLVFRPGGHGALLENLDQLDGDIIFIKNIDNVVPDNLKSLTVLYKKILGGYLIKLQRKIYSYAADLAEGRVTEKQLAEIIDYCKKDLYISFPSDFDYYPLNVRCEKVYQRLNRPLRVCGVVKNVGEPGGGPFWVEEDDGTLSLQIVEEIQVDSGSEKQRSLWNEATHFNPVDLVCGVRDYKSQKFDLKRFVNRKAISIARKTEKGRELKALELPGLWNGAMADWNTVLVEVPLETFNPVKTVYDLLRSQHQ